MMRPAATIVGYRPLRGLGTVGADDLARWQRSEFTWSDYAWCGFSSGGRLPMHPNVPNVDPGYARVWPCILKSKQQALNEQAKKYAQTQAEQPPIAVPVVLPPLPPLPGADPNVEAPASTGTQVTAKLALAGIALAVVGVMVYRRRGKMRQNPPRRPRVTKLSEGTYRVTFNKDQSFVVSVPLFWVQIGSSEKELRDLAIESAKEQLRR